MIDGREQGTRRCAGCGVVLPFEDGPTHPYIGASPECWARFGELLACGRIGLAGDAYAVQHPGVPERRAIQSVGTHIVWLCLVFERGADPAMQPRMLRRILSAPPPFAWLEPPEPNGTVTVLDVLEDRASRREYAQSVWRAWAPHHARVRRWADAASG